ncbi:MAG: ester cyclase [Myxococcales bacterium]|nr:ester cyclase [Myxococcales bacterium]
MDTRITQFFTPARALLASALTLGLAAAACDDDAGETTAEPGALTEQEREHLETFDDLDFNVFSGQEWERLGHSHAQDIIVHWPDGRTTEGIEPHLEDLKAMFVFAPDTRIVEHPIRVASGEWTAVMGVMQGTFSEPMPQADGTVIEPTGRAFVIPMSTLAHWQDGTMDEEWLFWDNLLFYSQLGLIE